MSLPPFSTLLADHRDGLYRFLAASVGPIDAEDCLSETVLAALRAYPSLPHARNLRGWLYTIAARKAVDLHRARARRPTPVADPPEQPVLDDHPDGELWARVRALPPGQRDALLLRFAADLDYADVARVLRISRDAARQRVAGAIATLRKELDP